MISRIKEWLSEFRPHLVTDGEFYAVRRRRLLGMELYCGEFWWDRDSRWFWSCLTDLPTAIHRLERLHKYQNLRKVDPKKPVRLVEGGEK